MSKNENICERKSVFSKNAVIFAFLAVFFAFLACFLPVSTAFADEADNTYVVTANSAVVFESPDFASAHLATLSNKDEILLFIDGAVPQEFENGGYVFFKTANTYETESGFLYGYILSDLVTPKTNVIVSIPNFNAKTNISCDVYAEKDLNSEIISTLEKNTQIFLYEGFVSKSQFTAIAFVKDNQVMYGYLQTKNINPNGINPLIITCIIIILAVLGIIFAFLFMKNKKAKKVKLKNTKTVKEE